MTIKDIARISGCSVSTISRVINDRPDVRPETKEHVLKVMREAGFTPNTNARQLKIQQSRSLVFVVKGTRNIFFSDFLVQLQRAATLYGYNGIVSYLDENANEIDAAEKILREIKPKGMIFLGGSVTNFQNGFANISVPSVLATLVSNELDFPNLSMVGVDDRAAAKAAVSHLIAQGHRKIAVLGGPATSFPSRMRRLGAQDAMEDAGLVLDDKLYGLCNYDFESAYHAMNSLLARRAEFTALFAMSDVIAFGAIRALVSAGIRVPEDVSVIGFDGITMSRYCVPVMTTIVQPSEQIALQSIELLVRQIEHGAPAQTVTLQPELQQGESVCPCRRNDSV
ncbi:LacI family DNA-binding transcriptional regulator [Faecalibacterium sp. Marseille-Q0746]|uniref:LacI family DNA-binding transcriptional regulator n=1 Tax=Faecalibacterium sp. Marseille-Q0746 TaxID=2817019 RepID=UPI001A9A9F5A|nr:LacI family DNA-binding transcriptional regulator [Faecalibacterium sp. Marseille-Q0746]MBO1344845.1 LacI family DNA-binding transcriptional regulator [Faecalibacterium sp. Marseille-Q0746]